MREEIELITDPYRISFICSFGYKVVSRTRNKNWLLDEYVLRPEEGKDVVVQRKDFYRHVAATFGGVEMSYKPTELNPLIFFDRF